MMKIKSLSWLTVLSVSIIFVSACGKSDTSQPTTDTSLSPNPQSSSPNLVYNGDFELGTTYPEGWTTKNQFLNDVTGWDTEVTHNSAHSLKIENIGGTDASWKGQPIVFNKPVQSFSASVWSKTKGLKDNKGKFQLIFDVYLKGDSDKEIIQKVSANIQTNKTDWQETSQKFIFASDISKIVPYCIFADGTGTVWLDDLSVNSIQIDWNKSTTLFDSNKGGSFTGIFEKGEDYSFTFKGSQTVRSSDFISVCPDSIYKLSGEFKSLSDINSILYFGFAPYTKEKKFISHESSNYIEKTETELVKDCMKNDKVIFVKNALNWEVNPNVCVAFNIDDSGNCSDLPNFNLSSAGIQKITKNEDCTSVELKHPCGVTYPAGTKVRLHLLGNTYIYNVASEFVLKKEWTNISNLITTINDKSMITFVNKLYPKTEFIKILLLTNFGNPKAVLQVKNVKLEEIKVFISSKKD